MLKELIVSSLRTLADNIELGNTNMSESELQEVFDRMQELNERNAYMSKYDACRYLHVSRATFDRWVADGKLPQGAKHAGLKELTWEKKALEKAKTRIKSADNKGK